MTEAAEEKRPRSPAACWYAGGLEEHACRLQRALARTKKRASRLYPEYQGEHLRAFEQAMRDAIDQLEGWAEHLRSHDD